MEQLPDPSERRKAATEAHHRRTLMGLGYAFVGLLLLVVAVGWFTDTKGPDPGDREAIWTTRFETLEGSTLQLRDFEGTPVVLNLFASWCGPCRTEMPEFQEVSAEMGSSVQFVGLNADENSLDAARELVSETGVTFPIAIGGTRTQLEEIQALTMPTTVIYHADGTRCELWSGALRADKLTELIDGCKQ